MNKGNAKALMLKPLVVTEHLETGSKSYRPIFFPIDKLGALDQ
jgi:hypothetical protein